MKNIFKTIAFVTALLVSISCEDQVLDTKPGDTYSEADIFSNIKLTQSLVDYTYNVTDSWGFNMVDWWTRRMGIENASDECWFHFVPQNFLITRSLINPNNMGFFRNKWAEYYQYIGQANTFLSKIDASPVMKSNPKEAAVLKGEMKFLRAYSYAKLINFHGGVPIIDKPFKLTDDFIVPRNAYQECVNFIVKDLDDAAALIPDVTRNGVNFGRVSKGACLALKSRVLLYAASPLHDPSNNASPRGPLYDYTKSTKWQDAAAAAKAVIDLNAFTLVSVNTANDYQKMFLSPNAELIFGRPYSPEYPTAPGDFNTLPDKAQSPNSSNGWGLSNPNHTFVQDFKMANGKHISEPGSGYDATKMYEGREMRFYANINFHGAIFRGKVLDYSSPGGGDSKVAPGQVHFAATGYNSRKFLDESITIDAQQSAKRPYPLARLSEIYLNFAEAQYNLGNEAEARKYVSLVAQRVGLPAITSTGTALLNDIKYERQMELYFEGHRYFDLRRWTDADKLGEKVMGVQWEKRNTAGVLDADGTLKMLGPLVIEARAFAKQNYYLPIPLAEVEKAKLEQNAGY